MSTQIPVNAGNLPGGFCPATLQALLNGFSAAMSVTLPAAGGGLTISATKPSSTSDIWFRIDNLGRFLGLYLYGQGAWLSGHPLVPGLTQWWFSALPDFTVFDGGDANSLGAASGPMWQQAVDGNNNLIAAQFPVAAGTLPSGTVLAIGGTGGEETHILIPAEAVTLSHYHNQGAPVSSSYVGGTVMFFPVDAAPTSTGTINSPDARIAFGGSGSGFSSPRTSSVGSTVGNTPHNTMPPFVVGYLLQRTTRLFYSIA